MATRKLFLLPGDGIGPEAMAEVEKLIGWMNAALGAGFETERGLVGGSAYDAHGKAISDGDMATAMAAPSPSWPPGMARWNASVAIRWVEFTGPPRVMA